MNNEPKNNPSFPLNSDQALDQQTHEKLDQKLDRNLDQKSEQASAQSFKEHPPESNSQDQTNGADHSSKTNEDLKRESGAQRDRLESEESKTSIADAITASLESLGDFFDRIANQHKVKTYTLEQILNRLEPSIDQEMRDISAQKNITPLGGELILTEEGAKSGRFKIDINLYFLDQEDQYVLRNRTISPQLMILTQEAKRDLIKNAPIKYPIEVPDL